ncbi:DUF2891 domain-containing protein [Jiangella rhizosphaerae]|uniref:DUF2891 domain-containing protein n=1 Tax=Jiangella rhizosphaerae TaxID=2293569 RepID=A0A418KSZ1_9ACTN|nr:DUF2891 domain-containing protein [Jiangella rhizosphaerae]RIQ28603.1 DUF2891 domain-containing protein [Jiangella rhizosphaerae]
MTGRLDLLHENAAAYARTALACIDREYPHLPMIYAVEPGPYPQHRDQHPAFYGSLDWHSAVEMHWMLVRLLRLAGASLPTGLADEVRAGLGAHLTPSNLEREAEFFASGIGRTRERPYGWGWLLTLTHELSLWSGDPDGAAWAAAVRPLSDVLTANLLAWLPAQTYPVRGGLHPNSAFGLLRSYDGATAELRDAIHDAVGRWYLDDTDYPAQYEPSGSDFLSPALAEAELVARVLPGEDFAAWFGRFLPGAASSSPSQLFEPVTVSDPSDGQLAHLAGLNLSRAWSMLAIAAALPDGAPAAALTASAERHAVPGLPYVVGGDYMVEHWLAAYAVGYLTA